MDLRELVKLRPRVVARSKSGGELKTLIFTSDRVIIYRPDGSDRPRSKSVDWGLMILTAWLDHPANVATISVEFS